jgi:type III secretion protein J
LEKWHERWTNGLEEDELAIVVFPNQHNEGLIFFPDEFDDALQQHAKKIAAKKTKAASAQVGGGGSGQIFWNITVSTEKMVEAMAILNQAGLPRRQGITLLDLFAKKGLMTTDKEETIRYQAGIEEELKNIIRKIDGILDADVQISFPSAEIIPGATPPKAKASVYIKHQGVFDDPNNHLESKVKRLLAGAIENLDFKDVSVISDKSKLSDISIKEQAEVIAAKARGNEYVSIWSIIMTKNSASTFRTLFFTLISLVLIFAGFIGWLIYKYYPIVQKEKNK